MCCAWPLGSSTLAVILSSNENRHALTNQEVRTRPRRLSPHAVTCLGVLGDPENRYHLITFNFRRQAMSGMTATKDVLNKVPLHGLVHDWLGSEAVARLLQFAQSNEHHFKDTMVGGEEGEKIDETIRVSKRLQCIDGLKSELRPKFKLLLPLMFDKLGIKPFIPSRIEVELVAHGDGAFFARHNDTVFDKGRGRVISAVYYFYALPKAFSGGVLRIHSMGASGQKGTFADIAPDYDTLVFFPSFFPHEVLPVKCPSRQFLDSRFAINFWIHLFPTRAASLR